MITVVCQHKHRNVHGKTKTGVTRYKCKNCGKTFTESTSTLDGMRIGLDKAEQILSLLCDGASIAMAARFTKTDPHTVIDLMVLMGERCQSFMESEIRGIFVDDLQVDEIHQFVLCRQRTARLKRYAGGCGDSYTFTAIDRHTKLLVAWHFGKRNEKHTSIFCRKLKVATAGRFQLSSDGWTAYPQAVKESLGQRVDYGMLIKQFGKAPAEDSRRGYAPPRIIGAHKKKVLGMPERDRICTSHCERMNGSIRNWVKRMGRLTYCFSKKWDNHRAALALFFCHYNFCRKHKSLKGLTPAMAHGLAIKPWTIRELIEKTLHT